jgi:hypothetical protein
MDSRTHVQAENSAYSRKSEEELILICGGDREAFGELAPRHRRMAFQAPFCVLRDEIDSERGELLNLAHVHRPRQDAGAEGTRAYRRSSLNA